MGLILIWIAVYLFVGLLCNLYILYVEYLDGVDLTLQDMIGVAFCFIAWPCVMIMFAATIFEEYANKTLIKGKAKNDNLPPH